MIESLCYAVVVMGVIAAVAVACWLALWMRLGRLLRQRDRLARENALLRRRLDGGVRQARAVNATLDRIATDLAGELLRHGGTHEK